MVCVGCSLDSFSISLLSLKQQQNLMKIMFSCISFPKWPYIISPLMMKKTTTGKLYGLTGMQYWCWFESPVWHGSFHPVCSQCSLSYGVCSGLSYGVCTAPVYNRVQSHASTSGCMFKNPKRWQLAAAVCSYSVAAVWTPENTTHANRNE